MKKIRIKNTRPLVAREAEVAKPVRETPAIKISKRAKIVGISEPREPDTCVRPDVAKIAVTAILREMAEAISKNRDEEWQKKVSKAIEMVGAQLEQNRAGE